MRGSEERPASGEVGINVINAFFHQDIVRTPITESLTSNRNVRYLMEELQRAVLVNTGKLIGPQSIQSLGTIMKHEYWTMGPYAVHLPDMEVERLNRSILQIIIHETTQAVESYGRFLKDSQSQPIPPDRPMNSNTKGSRQFETNRFL